MVGITLSPEQIRSAPAEVRRWLEQEIAGTLGLRAVAPGLQAPRDHLIGCSLEEARAILSLVRHFPPAVATFFELGCEPAAPAGQGLRVLRLDEMVRRTHLQSPQQIATCLRLLDQAAKRVHDDPEAVLTAVDDAGNCLVSEATAHSVLSVWQEFAMGQEAPAPGAAPKESGYHAEMPAFQLPYPTAPYIPGQPGKG